MMSTAQWNARVYGETTCCQSNLQARAQIMNDSILQMTTPSGCTCSAVSARQIATNFSKQVSGLLAL